MESKRLEIINSKKMYYKKKRNIILFFILFWLNLCGLLFIFNDQIFNFNQNLLMNLLLIVLILTLVILIKMKPYLFLYKMELNYYDMLSNNKGIQEVSKEILSYKWIQNLIDEGFKIGVKTTKYDLYYKRKNNLSEIHSREAIFLFVLIVKDKDFDPYDNEIDYALESIYLKEDPKKMIQKRIVLQFKLYKEITDDILDQIDKSIIYQMGPQVLIHLNVGYFTKENKVYYIHPKKRYSSKYMYFACKWIENHTI